MRQKGRLAIALILFLGALVPGGAQQRQDSDPLAPHRPKAPDQKARAAIFAKDVSWPLKPGTTRIDNLEEGAGPPRPSPEYSAFLRDLTCSSELVILATPIQKQAFLADNDSSIFTDYSVAAEQFLRGKSAHEPGADTTLVVSLSGGTIDTAAGAIEVRDQEPMELNQRYVLFLKRLPKTNAFGLTGPYFVAAGAYPGVRTKLDVPADVTEGRKTTATLLADIRSAAGRCPNGGAK